MNRYIENTVNWFMVFTVQTQCFPLVLIKHHLKYTHTSLNRILLTCINWEMSGEMWGLYAAKCPKRLGTRCLDQGYLSSGLAPLQLLVQPPATLWFLYLVPTAWGTAVCGFIIHKSSHLFIKNKNSLSAQRCRLSYSLRKRKSHLEFNKS